MKMKVGPFGLSFKEKGPPLLELGAPGTVFFGGMVSEEEYNPDLRGDKAIAVYEKMRRSDGQVKATLLACELPLRSARWDVKAAGEGRQDQEVAQFIRDNLFEQMTITWDDFLRHILLMLPFGFSVFEKVWELVDGRYRWRKFAPRLPKTIHKWYFDKEGGLDGVQQFVWKNFEPFPGRGGETKGPAYEFVNIPVEKLLAFSLSREGSNFEGISLLRAAYKHWYYKDQLYRIDGIAAERHGVGLAVFKYPSSASKEDRDKVSEIGERLHAHERAYVAIPSTMEFDLKGVAGQLHDIVRSIEHHDLQIVRSILAQFINLGSSDVGSYALSQDQSGFFLMALQAVGRNICDTVNRHAIRQLVDYNWSVDRYPKLVVSGLEYTDIGTFAKAISDLTAAGALLPDRDIEAEVRRLLHLPPAKPEKGKEASLRLTEFRPMRHPRGAERHVAFAEINDRLNGTEEEFVRVTKEVQDRQIAKIVDMVVEDIEKGEIDRITAIPLPLGDKMALAIERVLVEIFEYGQVQVKEELKKQRANIKAQEPAFEPLGEAEVATIREFLRTRAKATSNVLGSKLRAAMAWESLRQIKAGTIDRVALTSALTALSDRELAATAKFSVSEAFNLGRHVEARAEADDIDRVIYSAILDENSCGPCADLDGREYEFPSSEWDEVAPPYRECEGQDRCRCVGVYVYRAERR